MNVEEALDKIMKCIFYTAPEDVGGLRLKIEQYLYALLRHRNEEEEEDDDL